MASGVLACREGIAVEFATRPAGVGVVPDPKDADSQPEGSRAGLLFIAFGLFTVVTARGYPMGTAFRMGPSYFPSILGGVLACLGVIVAARALWTAGTVAPPQPRSRLLVLASVVAFAVLVHSAGLVVVATLAP